MKLLKYLMLLVIATGTAASAYAQIGQETAFGRQLNTRDDQPLREFVESKENIELKDKSKNLELSGDVRFEWRNIQEKGVVFYTAEEENYANPPPFPIFQNFRALRGGSHVDRDNVPISVNDFDVEFNFKVRYTYKDAWAMAHLQFDNPAGIRGRNDCFGTFAIYNKEGSHVEEKVPRDSRWALKGSGAGEFFTLKRAFIGYNVFADGKQRLDIEIGRQKLDDIFDSEIEFSNRFDGFLFRYAYSVENAFDWYLTAGVFVIDERVNHFGYAAEVGLIDIYETGLDVRYNFIDWQKNGRNRCLIYNPLGANFLNSQISFTYTYSQNFYDKEIPVEFYSGFLINHAAKKTVFTHRKRKNLGWYAGVYIGNVDKKGDWSLDIEYIAVQAQAVPEYDVGSIGRGNIYNEDMLDILNERFKYSDASINDSSVPTSGIVGIFPRRGNANFVGWRFEFLYAITDNFSIDTIFEFSDEEDRCIGGRHQYRDFEIEAVYAF